MAMPQTDRYRHAMPLILGASGVMLIGAAVLLWAHYGTAVFLEMIRTGYVACFG